MTEESEKKQTFFLRTSHYRSRVVWFAIWLLFLFSNRCFSVQEITSVAVLSQVDLSVPLWGGAEAAMASIPQGALEIHEVKLHHFDELPCGNCHQSPTDSTDQEWKSTVNINQSCTSFGCHEYDEKMNHPLDVTLPAGISAEYTSSDSPSTVTCLSCHLPQETQTFEGFEDKTDYYLQAPALVGCDSCHSRMPGSVKQQSHWKFSQKAHLVSLNPGGFEDVTSGNFTVFGIDRESNTCISCHDEITVTVPATNETLQQKAERFRNMHDHPIGMDYRAIMSENSMYFNSLMGLEKSIRVFDGKIGCGSCHSLYSNIPGNLVLDNEDSAMCHTCHNR